MSGKYALIIANTEYSDPNLAQLSSPGKDAEELARVLKDKDIAAFDDVRVVMNQPESSVREKIDEFFDLKKPDDLLLLYFSGHGVRDEMGALYLAVKNTSHTRLRSTAIRSDFVREAMDQTRSKRVVLILDCCNSGAFAQGTKAITGGSVGTAFAFEGKGYGRIVLTASDSTQFAWEGDKIIGGETENSLFTHYLVQGMEGEADKDGDGQITIDELYDYAYEQIVQRTPKQTPGKWSYKQQGDLLLIQNLHPKHVKPVALPKELVEAMEDSRTFVREGAVEQLKNIMAGKNPGLALSAYEALKKIAEGDDSRRVAEAAKQALVAVGTLARQDEEKIGLSNKKHEEERIAKEKAEAEDKAKEERERLAAKMEEERKAKEKAEAEGKAKEERERLAAKMEEEQKAKEIAEAARKAEKDRLTQARIQAMRAAADEKQKLGGQAPVKPSATPQKKSFMSPFVLIGIGLGAVVILGLCMISVPSILGLLAPQPTIVPTEIRVTNPVLPIKSDTDIPAPIIVTDTDTPTPTYAFKPTSTKEIPTPTFTPVPVILDDPADFIRFYFDNINGRNFDLTWSLLSDAYKAKTNPDGINQYKDFWDDYTVDIIKVDYTRPSTTSALATLRTTFFKNNSSSNNILSYYLIWDSGRGTWLFDPMPVFGSSTDTTCSTVPKQLSVGVQAKVVTAAYNLMLRETPAEGSAVVEKMPPSTIVKVFDGPICGPYRSFYFWWWKVQAPSGNIGWVVEGSDTDDRIFIRPAQ